MSKYLVENPHAQSVEDINARLDVDTAQGLGQTQVLARLAAHGPNRLRRQKKKGTLSILFHQFNSIIVWLLAAANGVGSSRGPHPAPTALVAPARYRPSEEGLQQLASLRLAEQCWTVPAAEPKDHPEQFDAVRCCTTCHHAGAGLHVEMIKVQASCRACHRS